MKKVVTKKKTANKTVDSRSAAKTRSSSELASSKRPKEGQEWIGVQEATMNAVQYVKSVIPSATDFLVEEVELREGPRANWLITLSMTLPSRASSFLAAMGGQKEYKSIEVAAESGLVRSMKIKTFK